jgi:hypothetical protein
MSIVEQIAETVRLLPPERQQEVLDFVEFLARRCVAGTPRHSSEGLWADLDIHITDEDIDEVRREMWQNLPREDIP